jgi:hypothetical protein
MTNLQYACLMGLITIIGCGNMFVVASWGRAIIAAIKSPQ